jgi:hypothetical protein
MTSYAPSDTSEGRLGKDIPRRPGHAISGMQTWPLKLEVTPGGRIVQLGAGGWCVVLLASRVLDRTYMIPGPLLHSIPRDICMFGVRFLRISLRLGISWAYV